MQLRLAHPDAFLAMWLCAVGASAMSVTVAPLASILVVLIGIGALARVPWRWVVAATASPLPIVVMYGATVGHLSFVDFVVAAMRGAVTVTGVLVAVNAVPGPRLLATPVGLMPSWAGTAILVTHRASFLLASRVAAARRTIRLRGGLPPWLPLTTGVQRRAVALGAIGGVTLLGAIDLGARHGDALRLRGLPPRAHRGDFKASSFATHFLLAVALFEIAVAAAGRAFRW
jgi:hypothetical protein